MKKTGHKKSCYTVPLKATVEKVPLQFDYTEAGITLQLLSGDPPGPPDHSFPHKHRHPGDDGAEDIIIFKGQDPSSG
jgi:hypothetical protein